MNIGAAKEGFHHGLALFRIEHLLCTRHQHNIKQPGLKGCVSLIHPRAAAGTGVFHVENGQSAKPHGRQSTLTSNGVLRLHLPLSNVGKPGRAHGILRNTCIQQRACDGLAGKVLDGLLHMATELGMGNTGDEDIHF